MATFNASGGEASRGEVSTASTSTENATAENTSTENTVVKILLVEDDRLIADSIQVALAQERYDVTSVSNGREALENLVLNHNSINFSGAILNDTIGDVRHDFNLIILDIMLPQLNGLDICRILRRQGDLTPILILSGRSSETDRVLGLEVGADDYLTKPFGLRELVARCRALLRRYQLPSPDLESAVLSFRDLVLYPQEHRIFLRNQEVILPPKEFKLLETFMRSPKQVFSREQLMQKIWGVEYTGETKTVDVHVRWLREKLERDPSRPEYLITVRGFGYRLG
jgi:two-component system, OmpR family, phosphate regulon response regulator PhoB